MSIRPPPRSGRKSAIVHEDRGSDRAAVIADDPYPALTPADRKARRDIGPCDGAHRAAAGPDDRGWTFDRLDNIAATRRVLGEPRR